MHRRVRYELGARKVRWESLSYRQARYRLLQSITGDGSSRSAFLRRKIFEYFTLAPIISTGGDRLWSASGSRQRLGPGHRPQVQLTTQVPAAIQNVHTVVENCDLHGTDWTLMGFVPCSRGNFIFLDPILGFLLTTEYPPLRSDPPF
jgi:hypothetical protein